MIIYINKNFGLKISINKSYLLILYYFFDILNTIIHNFKIISIIIFFSNKKEK